MASGVSERRSCALAGIQRSSVRYQATDDTDGALLARVRELALRHPRFGYRRIWALLRREGRIVNRKRIWRLWKRAGLALRRRRRPRRRLVSRVPGPLVATHRRHVVTYDFMFDRTSEGRTLKILTVVDEFTRESLAIAVGWRMTSADVMGVLQKAFDNQGWPEYLRSDNGPEFVAESLEKWLRTRGVKTHHIAPASPWQNAFCESFNDKVRTECLSLELFVSAEEAAEVLETWRKYYNEERPHSSLGYQTPAEYSQAQGTGKEAKELALGLRTT